MLALKTLGALIKKNGGGMIKQILLLIFLFVLQSCVSTTAHWQSRKHRPKKEGIVFYNPTASLFDSTAVQKRRADALQKMRNFCQGQKPQIVSEKNKEEITGYQTNYHSVEDNPQASYREEVHAGKNFYVKSAGTIFDPFLSSQASKTEQAIIRNRLYIHFVCE